MVFLESAGKLFSELQNSQPERRLRGEVIVWLILKDIAEREKRYLYIPSNIKNIYFQNYFFIDTFLSESEEKNLLNILLAPDFSEQEPNFFRRSFFAKIWDICQECNFDNLKQTIEQYGHYSTEKIVNVFETFLKDKGYDKYINWFAMSDELNYLLKLLQYKAEKEMFGHKPFENIFLMNRRKHDLPHLNTIGCMMLRGRRDNKRGPFYMVRRQCVKNFKKLDGPTKETIEAFWQEKPDYFNWN